MDKLVEQLVKGDNEFVMIVNDFGKKISNGNLAQFDLQNVFRKLGIYSARQFRIESEIIRSKEIDKRFEDENTKNHSYFISEMAKLCEELSVNISKSRNLLYFLIAWIDKHIVYENNVLIKQCELIEKGKDPIEAYEISRFRNRNSTNLVRLLNSMLDEILNANKELAQDNIALKKDLNKKTKDLRSINSKMNLFQTNDELTGLPNRRAMINGINQLIRQSKSLGGEFASMFLVFNEYYDINEAKGVDTARNIVLRISNILRSAVRSDDIVCALNNAEFGIICPDCNQTSAINIATTIKNRMKNDQELSEFLFSNEGTQISLSFGVVIANGKSDIKSVLKITDENLKKAKFERGKIEISILN